MKINVMKLLLFLGLSVSLTGCIRENLDDCPPLQIALYVADKNYSNIDEAVELGLMEMKAENLPFADYVQTLHVVVTDADGNVIFQQQNAPVADSAEMVQFVLPASLPYGSYTVKAWGNLQSELALQGVAESAMLEGEGARDEDVYMAAATIDYCYGGEVHQLGMKRAKGNLLMLVEYISEQVNYSTQMLDGVMTVLDWQGNYTQSGQKEAAHDWSQTGSFYTQTLAGPSPRKDGTTLQAQFWAKDALGQLDPLEGEVKVPEPVAITLKPNLLTILKYVYDDVSDDFLIYIYVDDEWQRIHSMEID